MDHYRYVTVFGIVACLYNIVYIMHMNKIIFTLLMLFSSVVYSGEYAVHTFTTHIGVSGLEDFTPGVSYTNDNNLRFGVLSNSFRLPSLYAVKLFPINKSSRFGVGFISGYKWEDGLQGDKNSALLLLALEEDITDNISIIWFGHAFNLVIKLN